MKTLVGKDGADVAIERDFCFRILRVGRLLAHDDQECQNRRLEKKSHLIRRRWIEIQSFIIVQPKMNV